MPGAGSWAPASHRCLKASTRANAGHCANRGGAWWPGRWGPGGVLQWLGFTRKELSVVRHKCGSRAVFHVRVSCSKFAYGIKRKRPADLLWHPSRAGPTCQGKRPTVSRQSSGIQNINRNVSFVLCNYRYLFTFSSMWVFDVSWCLPTPCCHLLDVLGSWMVNSTFKNISINNAFLFVTKIVAFVYPDRPWDFFYKKTTIEIRSKGHVVLRNCNAKKFAMFLTNTLRILRPGFAPRKRKFLTFLKKLYVFFF